MKNSKLAFIGFADAFGIAVYIFSLSFIMQNAEKVFGKMDNVLAPAAFLLLFVLSAAVTGALALGRPAVLYFENRKPEAFKLFFYTIGWLFAITLAVFAAQLLK